jgi:hypothetical protein
MHAPLVVYRRTEKAYMLPTRPAIWSVAWLLAAEKHTKSGPGRHSKQRQPRTPSLLQDQGPVLVFQEGTEGMETSSTKIFGGTWTTPPLTRPKQGENRPPTL